MTFNLIECFNIDTSKGMGNAIICQPSCVYIRTCDVACQLNICLTVFLQQWGLDSMISIFMLPGLITVAACDYAHTFS